MSIFNRHNSTILMILLGVNCVLFSQSVKATEWWDNVDAQSGFSEFAPPTSPGSYSHSNTGKNGDIQWRSGSSFKQQNKTQYAPPVASKNPWKPVGSFHYKKTFSSQRPWGKLPDKKPPRTTNMRIHDQRFKQWSHQIDSSYRNSIMSSDPLNAYGYSALPYINGYGFPGSLYNSPLITPSIHPGVINNPFVYGLYPGGFYPYTGLPGRSRFW